MTATRADISVRYSHSNPCPVCVTGSKGCSLNEDDVLFCRGEPKDPVAWKEMKRCDNGFRCFRRADDKRHLTNGTHTNTRTPHPKPNAKPDGPPEPTTRKSYALPTPKKSNGETLTTWRQFVRANHNASKNSQSDKEEAARSLGLPVEGFASHPMKGWAWTAYGIKDESRTPAEWVPALMVPMIDEGGEPCGCMKRFTRKVSIKGGEPTNKLMMGGGTAGVMPGARFESLGGDFAVYPEGPSNTIACEMVGIPATGRPSNLAGIDIIIAHAKRDSRKPFAAGDNDERFNEVLGRTEWPGKVGAEATARAIANETGRSAFIFYPPPEHKDMRDWIIAELEGQAELDFEAVGETIRKHIFETAVEVRPGTEPDPMDQSADEMPAETHAPQYEFIDAETFLAADYRREFHIDRVLSKGEQAVWAGPIKAMKTTTLIDAAVSMATMTPFLGTFNVHRRVRVGVASGESGEATLQETTRRILKAKGLEARHAAGWLKFCFDKLPQFLDPAQIAAFTNSLKALDCELIFIDPAYLCLSAGIEHGNIFHVGEALDAVAQELKRSGITPVIAHHANKQLKTGGAMDLQDMAYSGFDAYARQWVLLNRQRPYTGDGKHDLWMRTGGSAGHGGVWSVHIEEGVVDENFNGRTWGVRVSTLGAAKAEQIDEREAKKEETGRKKLDHDKTKVLLAIDAELTMHEAATKNAIRNRTTFTEARFKTTIEALEDLGAIVPIEFMKSIGNGAERKTTGWKRPERGAYGASGACSELDVQGDARNMQEHHADDGTP